ncbi:hypothetical protein [Marivita hallyeonensis]|uniref:Uncharacterized protein n=1 Tax=Marivita hallyeonensis TaxID=996342 RepID=A0A1M5N1W2_9RHOB|nr:hypothetical protein [Marivita hallyeonensis]SHG83544.1 hypothetical protein SAMN05443551_0738 [Marivita hallyeonensis]
MRIPKIEKRSASQDVDDDAPAFWASARALDDTVDTRTFAGDLSGLGFVQTRSNDDLARMRSAMATVWKMIPDLGKAVRGAQPVEIDGDVEKLDRWINAPHCLLWSHPSEDTLAITLPYTYSRPYGKSAAALFHFTAVNGAAEQNGRNKRLASLKAAKHADRKHQHLVRTDAYVAKGSGFGRTFAFAKHCTVGGRDQETLAARGFALSQQRATAPNMPSLFLETTFEDIAM